MRLEEFRAMVERGEVIPALMDAPFGYSSRYVANGFQFTIDSGPLKGHIGVARTMDEAIRRALEEQ